MFLTQKGNNQSHDYSRGNGSKEDVEEKIPKVVELDIIKVRDMTFNMFNAECMVMKKKDVGSHWRRSNKAGSK